MKESIEHRRARKLLEKLWYLVDMDLPRDKDEEAIQIVMEELSR